MTDIAQKGARKNTGRLMLIVALLVVSLIVAGLLAWRLIGGGSSADGTGEAGEAGELARKVAQHGDATRGLQVIDLAAAREALGLPEDADPLDRGEAELTGQESVDQRRFSGLVSVLAHLRMPSGDPALTGIDLGAVSALATTVATIEGSLTLMRTSQDPEEIAEAFVDTGDYERDGDALVYTGSLEPPVQVAYTHLAWGDGLLALSSDPAADPVALRAAIDDDGGSGEVLVADLAIEVMEATSAPGVLALLSREDAPDPASCAEALVAVDPVTDDGAVYIRPRSDAAEIGSYTDEGFGSLGFGEPEVDGDWVRVQAEIDDPANGLLVYVPEMAWSQIWSCR